MSADSMNAPPGAWEAAALPGAWTQLRTAPDLRLFLGLPEAPPPPAGYPLVVVLDAGDHFVLMQDAARRLARRPAATGVGPAVILGVDFDGPREGRPAWRHRMLTWSAPDDPTALPAGHEWGGGAAFLGALTTLIRTLDAGVPLDPDRRALFGHSLAGGFALHALAAGGGGFRTYGAISPSIWWAPEDLRRRLASGAPQGSLLIAAGEREEGPAARPHAAPRRMVGHVQDFAELLGRSGGLRVTAEIYPEEDHASVVNVAVTRFLRLACPPAL